MFFATQKHYQFKKEHSHSKNFHRDCQSQKTKQDSNPPPSDLKFSLCQSMLYFWQLLRLLLILICRLFFKTFASSFISGRLGKVRSLIDRGVNMF